MKKLSAIYKPHQISSLLYISVNIYSFEEIVCQTRWHRPIYETAALEYRLVADEMMENMDRFWEDDDGERMRKASNAYDDSILTLADAIRFALEYDR